jgi:hypothetical protein
MSLDSFSPPSTRSVPPASAAAKSVILAPGADTAFDLESCVTSRRRHVSIEAHVMTSE